MSDDAPPLVSASFVLMALGRHLRDAAETRLRADGIAVRHLSALGHLSRDPGLSYSELARRAGLTPQSMQATLRTLEEMGAVHRDTDAGRGRNAGKSQFAAAAPGVPAGLRSARAVADRRPADSGERKQHRAVKRGDRFGM